MNTKTILQTTTYDGAMQTFTSGLWEELVWCQTILPLQRVASSPPVLQLLPQLMHQTPRRSLGISVVLDCRPLLALTGYMHNRTSLKNIKNMITIWCNILWKMYLQTQNCQIFCRNSNPPVLPQVRMAHPPSHNSVHTNFVCSL